MAKSFEVNVNPEILRWARERAGFSEEETAKKLKISIENYRKIETGKKKPTFTQIERLARIFKRPTAVFFLPEPPDEPPFSASFRIMPKSEQNLSRELRLAIRKARYYQSIANELMEDLGINPKANVKFATINDDPLLLAREERRKLGISIEEQFEFRNAYSAFNRWRNAVEAQNILVFQFKFPIESARGFSLMDKEPPVIVLNSSDNILARIFTLFHEYAHILLRLPEIYTGEETIDYDKEIESWCNKFASEFLVPENFLKNEKSYRELINKTKSLEEVLKILSQRFKVSKHAILTKLKVINVISNEEYEEISLKLKSQFIKEEKRGFSLPAHKRCIQEKGEKFVSIVLNAKEKEIITSADMIEYLSLKLDNLKRLIENKSQVNNEYLHY